MFTLPHQKSFAAIQKIFFMDCDAAKRYISKLCETIEETDVKYQSFLPEANREKRLLYEVEELFRKFPYEKPPLFGIPVGVKDIFHVDGFLTRAGSALPPEVLKDQEAKVVTQLKNLGALILGKTVTTEFAYAEAGPTRNPINIDHTPGGSSSGSAAAVRLGFTPLALGTQTIGSITRPASFCGVFGFKPSYGRIAADGVIPFSPTADHIGFFTNNIDDTITTAALLCNDWKQINNENNYKPVLGLVGGAYLKQAEPEIVQAMLDWLDELSDKGFIIKQFDLFKDIEKINVIHRDLIAAELAMVHEHWFAEYEELYRPNTRKMILQGKNTTIGRLHEARLSCKQWRNQVMKIQAENGIDVWLSPAATSYAPKGLSYTGNPIMNLPWTHCGLPTITFPIKYNTNGLPLGIQIAGSFYNDELLLLHTVNIIKAFEK